MPTGYTSGIIDGKTKTFEEFARICMRGMGACMHMRDDDFDAEYKERVPYDYHARELELCKIKLADIKAATDDQIVATEKSYIQSNIIEMNSMIEEINKRREVLEKFFSEAVNYEPPTKDHHGVRKLMIDQLRLTIDHDGNASYYEKRLEELKESLNNINPVEIRASRIEDYEEKIERHAKEYNEEIARCEESNEWVKVFLESIKGK